MPSMRFTLRGGVGATMQVPLPCCDISTFLRIACLCAVADQIPHARARKCVKLSTFTLS